MIFYGDRTELYFYLEVHSEIKKEIMENPSSAADQHIPSFFQNSCTGTGASEREENEDSSRNSSENPMRPMLGVSEESKHGNKPVVGGITCCVPECSGVKIGFFHQLVHAISA